MELRHTMVCNKMRGYVMKIIVWTIFVAVMFYSLGWAKPILIMDKNVKLSLEKYNRIGLPNLDKGERNEKSSIIEIDAFSSKTLAKLKKSFKSGYSVLESKKGIRVKNRNTKFDLSDIDTNRIACAKRMLKTVMPNDYVNQFMLISVDEVRSFSMSQGVQIEGRTFNFKRVFNGRVVRNEENFLKVRVDKNGYLENADIAMQDLRTLAEEVSIAGDVVENEAVLDSVISADFEFASVYDDNSLEKKEKIEEVKVGSVAEAYCEFVEGENKKLFPCLSYISKIKLTGNRFFDYIIDVPHSRKSWSDYHAKNKSATFDDHRF